MFNNNINTNSGFRCIIKSNNTEDIYSSFAQKSLKPLHTYYLIYL